MRVETSCNAAADLMTELGFSYLLQGPASQEDTNLKKLELARYAMNLVLALTSEVAEDTGNRHAKAYMVDQLTCLATEDHGFCSRQFNLDQWIEQLKSNDDEE